MIKEENRCQECNSALYPCVGDSCELRHYRALYCDKCKDEVEKLYIGLSGRELCADCALKELEVVE